MEEASLDSLEGGRFSLRRQLGRGGMGLVYEAFDRQWNRRVAMKTLRALDPEALIRLKNEFRALQGIRHPNLVRLDELLELGGRWLFTMELVDGVDFVRWVRRDGRFDEARLRAALRQLVEALQALHAAGKVHRDVKPSNVLVTAAGRVVLLDFGLITRVAADDALTEGLVVGTADYMAPEQAAGHPVSLRADWYAVGVMLYEALTGQLPFSGPPSVILDTKQQVDPPPPGSLAQVPADLDRLCLALLERDPERRIGFRELAARLGIAETTELAVAEAPFVGREAELRQLDEAYDDTRAGEVVTLIVHGESGIGKSALVERFVRGLYERSDDLLVLEGRCSDREIVPFNGFDGIVDGLGRLLSELGDDAVAALLPRDADALASVFPVLARVPAIASCAPPPGEKGVVRRKRAFAALRELLTELGRRRPLVLRIDDFQWADDDTLALRRSVMHDGGEAGRLLVATLRTTGDTRAFLRRAILSTEEPGEIRHLFLGPLGDQDALALARELEGNGAAESELRELVRQTGGHPLFLSELVQRRRNRLDGPADLHAAIRSRVELLSAEGRRLMEVLALGAGPVRQDIAAPAADLDADAYTWAAAETRAAGLTRVTGAGATASIACYHDQIRDAILEQLPPERRRALHRSLAEVIEWAAAGEVRGLYLHWLGAGDHVRAARAAELAAEEADRQLAFDLAAHFYARALELDDQPERRRLLLPRRAAALANAGRKDEAVAAYREAGAITDGAVRFDHLRSAAEVLLRNGDIDAGVALLRLVLREVGMRWSRTLAETLASIVWHRARLELRGLGWTERPAASLEPRALLRIDTAWSATTTLSLVDRARAADFESRGLLLALEAGDPYRVARAVIFEAAYSSMGGSHASARTAELLALGHRLAERSGHPHALAVIASVEAIAHAMVGELQAGARGLEQAMPLLQACPEARWELATAEYLHLDYLAIVGALAEVEKQVATLESEARAAGDLYTLANLANGHIALARLLRDDVAAARAASDETMRSWSQSGFHRQHWLALFAQVSFDLYQGLGERAWQRLRADWGPLRRSLLLRSQFVRIVALNLRARAALATGRRRQAEHDAAKLERERAPWAAALAALLRAGLGGERRAFERAAVQLDAVDLKMHAAIARRRAGQDDLWWREQGVANPDGFVRCFAPGGGR